MSTADHDPFTAPDFDRCALVTIDVQRDTLDGQPFEIPGTSAVLPRIAALAAAFRNAHRPVIHVLRLYQPDGSNAELCRKTPLQQGLSLVVAGTPGRLLAPGMLASDAQPDDHRLLFGELQPVGPTEWLMYNPRWGAFHKTPLEQHLRDLGVSTVVLAGCNFPNCVRATLYEATARDFRVVAISDGISNFDDKGWREIEVLGIVVRSATECAAALPRRGI